MAHRLTFELGCAIILLCPLQKRARAPRPIAPASPPPPAPPGTAHHCSKPDQPPTTPWKGTGESAAPVRCRKPHYSHRTHCRHAVWPPVTPPVHRGPPPIARLGGKLPWLPPLGSGVFALAAAFAGWRQAQLTRGGGGVFHGRAGVRHGRRLLAVWARGLHVERGRHTRTPTHNARTQRPQRAARESALEPQSKR